MVLISFDMGPDRLDMALAAVDMALAAVDMALAAVDTARGDFAMREIFVEPPTEESRIVRRDRNVPSVAKSHAKTANGRFVG